MKNWLRHKWRTLVSLALVVGVMVEVCVLLAQTPQPPAPYPNGMRVVVGADGSIPRNAPWGTCGTDNHACGAGDSQPTGVYGFVMPDPPVLDTGGAYYWVRVTYASPTTTGLTVGWSRGVPPFLVMLTPPQMIAGIAFNITADYLGPVLTQAICINDGANSPATMQLQSVTLPDGKTPGQQGTLRCPWPKAGVGNHKVVVKAVNGQGTMDSTEFQFAVTDVPVAQPPTMPNNLRITGL